MWSWGRDMEVGEGRRSGGGMMRWASRWGSDDEVGRDDEVGEGRVGGGGRARM